MKSLYPVYNHNDNQNNHNNNFDSSSNVNKNSVQDTSGTQSNDIYEHPSQTTYDDKTHTYNTYLPPSSYGSPNIGSSYGSPIQPTYGPPTYTSPGTASYYPHSSYGVPSSAPSYSYYPTASVAPTAPQQPYGFDLKSHEGFMAKLVKKFDLVLMSKLLLKLIIFKKIIKFIAIICLLLFIPTIKNKLYAVTGGAGDDEDRHYKFLDSYGRIFNDFYV